MSTTPLRHLACIGWLAIIAPATAQTTSQTGTPTTAHRDAEGTEQRTNDERPGPWDSDVGVYRVESGQSPATLATFPRAGVPSVARMKDGRLLAAFQHFPVDDSRAFDRVATSISADEGRTWSTPRPIEVRGLEDGLARPFDPTLVPLPDGRVRLYFTSNRSPDFRASVPQIYSAVSDDGVRFYFEPGIRFGVEGRIVIDCAVALHDGVFHLFAPDNGSADEFARGHDHGEPAPSGRAYHATSPDGLAFTRVADVSTDARNRWLGAAVVDGGTLAFFGTGPGPWPLVSADGVAWQRADSPVTVPGADPGATRLRDGSWLIVATTSPRDGTPSARRRHGAESPPLPPQHGAADRPTSIPQGDLHAGDVAPDFTLSDYDGKNPVTLSALRGEPVVLVFGSCSCPPFVRSVAAIEKLARQYGDKAHFVMVYIHEAHPTDGWALDGNQFQVKTPTTLAERCSLAKAFDDRIHVSFPIVVDTIGDDVASRYAPWPNRMYIIDGDGKIADAGTAGPQGTTESAKRGPQVLDRLLKQAPPAQRPKESAR
ncbi:MAG: deiodinase-like protein [Phycisphaerales bacterium]